MLLVSSERVLLKRILQTLSIKESQNNCDDLKEDQPAICKISKKPIYIFNLVNNG